MTLAPSPRRRHLLAALVFSAIMLAVPLAPAADAVSRYSEAGVSVTIVYDSTDGSATAVASELEGLLEDVSGFRRVRLVEARDGASFLASAEATRTQALVLVAHGSPDGFVVAGELLPWQAAHGAIARSEARHVFLGACWSAALAPLDGKTIHTAFVDLVDERLVAPQVFVDMMEEVTPLLRQRTEAPLLEHVNERGGLDEYFRLAVAPERPMSVECNDKMDRWYEGQDISSQGECIAYLHPDNFNCHSEAERRQSPCKDYTAADQERFNREASGTSTADASYGDDTWADGASSTAAASDASGDDAAGPSVAEGRSAYAYYDQMAKAFELGFVNNGNHIEVKLGKNLKPDRCWTALRVEDIVSGGMRTAIQKGMEALRSAVKPGAPINTDGSFLALRICGALKLAMWGFNSDPQTEVHLKGGIHADARLSAFGSVNLWIKVLYWEREFTVHFEAGASVPFKFDVSFGFRGCYNPDGSWDFPNFYWRGAFAGSVGRFGLFIQANSGYAGLGYRHDFGNIWNPDWDPTGWCPYGTSMSPPRNGASWSADAPTTPDAAVALFPMPLASPYQALVDAGLAVENANPTWVHVDEESRQAWRLTADLLELRSDDAVYNGMREKGVLDALGVREIGPHEKIVLDRTNPRVAAALGDPVEGLPVPRLSLLHDGVIVVPRGTPTSAAGQSVCSPDASIPDAALLQAQACAEYGTDQGIPYAGATVAAATEIPGAPSLVDPEPYTGTLDTVLGLPHEVACSQSVMRAPCVDARNLGSLGSGQGYVDFLREIHRQFQLIERSDKVTMLTTCAVQGGVQAPAPVVHPNGEVALAQASVDTCVQMDWALDLIDLKEANDQFAEGQVILADMEANSVHWGVSTVGKPLETLEGAPDVVGYVWSIACPFLPGCQ